MAHIELDLSERRAIAEMLNAIATVSTTVVERRLTIDFVIYDSSDA